MALYRGARAPSLPPCPGPEEAGSSCIAPLPRLPPTSAPEQGLLATPPTSRISSQPSRRVAVELFHPDSAGTACDPGQDGKC